MPADEELFNEREYLRLLDPPAAELQVGVVRRFYIWTVLLVHWLVPSFGRLLSTVTLLRWLTPSALRGAGVLAVAGGVLSALLIPAPLAWIPTVALAVVLTLEARNSGQRRVIIGQFEGLQAGAHDGAGLGAADLLRVELARIADLFQTVEDERAIPSGVGPKRSLDATMSVETVASSLQAAVSAEARIGFGPLSLPARFVIAAVDRVVRPPRIDGALHGSDDSVVVTARLEGQSRLSWRVPVEAAAHRYSIAASGGLSHELVHELALRIFTDIALGRSVRWQASREFVQGLDRVRACLRSPRDRKVNLRHAESHFLNTLSEDEDFPHAYYNLGVVYQELFTLTWSNGRHEEARNHLHAAERAFEKAVERDPTRWENYYALGQAYFQHQRFAAVTSLCDRMYELLPRRAMTSRAKVHELRASALLANGSPGESESAAARAVWRSLFAVFASRILRAYRTPKDELAGACLQTLGLVYASAQTRSGKRPWKLTRAIYGRARAMSVQRAELHLELGLRALGSGHPALARRELSVSRHSDPSRPLFLAAYAAALARSPRPWPDQPNELCIEAARSMCRSYSPSRDRATCKLVGLASDVVDDEQLAVIAHELAAAEEIAARRLSSPPALLLREEDVAAGQSARVEREIERDRGAIVPAAFLQAIGPAPIADLLLDEYGHEIWEAQRSLGSLRYLKVEPAPDSTEAANLQRQALASAEKATSINPLSVLAWMTLGDVHQEFADFENARRAWNNAITQDPDNPALYDRLGTSWWHLAFQGRSRPDRLSLNQARELFEKALLLYDSGAIEQQLHTRYRLAKLYAALLEFDAAIAQLRIVEAAGASPPIVGWVLLGRAYLARRDYSECEYYFGRVIECGLQLDDPEERPRRLEDNGIDPDPRSDERSAAVIGDRIDERLWPLAVVRAWGYLGLAFSHVERDGDLPKARLLVAAARQLTESDNLDLSVTPTRIPAACDDCLGAISWKEGDLENAEKLLEGAIRRNPFSRSYINLARVERDLGYAFPSSRGQSHSYAKRCIDHAQRLDPDHEVTDEMAEILAAVALEPADTGGSRAA
jgi:tetratricopeptide (TPR) repeat protein